MSGTLGLLTSSPKQFFADVAGLRRDDADHFDEAAVADRIAQRAKARGAKDWKRADEIRDELLGHGIQIQDTPAGTKWTVEI
jgi:cysteinyl-tRNA synthetase